MEGNAGSTFICVRPTIEFNAGLELPCFPHAKFWSCAGNVTAGEFSVSATSEVRRYGLEDVLLLEYLLSFLILGEPLFSSSTSLEIVTLLTLVQIVQQSAWVYG